MPQHLRYQSNISVNLYILWSILYIPFYRAYPCTYARARGLCDSDLVFRRTVLDKTFRMCYNRSEMEKIERVYGDITAIHIRERRLDRELMQLPSTIAQQIEAELIKTAQRTSPWLLPILMKLNDRRKHTKSDRAQRG
jgi:hypothetical protein